MCQHAAVCKPLTPLYTAFCFKTSASWVRYTLTFGRGERSRRIFQRCPRMSEYFGDVSGCYGCVRTFVGSAHPPCVGWLFVTVVSPLYMSVLAGTTVGCCIFLNTGRWPLHSPFRQCLSIRRSIYLNKDAMAAAFGNTDIADCILNLRTNQCGVHKRKSGATTAGSIRQFSTFTCMCLNGLLATCYKHVAHFYYTWRVAAPCLSVAYIQFVAVSSFGCFVNILSCREVRALLFLVCILLSPLLARDDSVRDLNGSTHLSPGAWLAVWYHELDQHSRSASPLWFKQPPFATHAHVEVTLELEYNCTTVWTL